MIEGGISDMKEIKYSKLAIKFLKKRDMVTRKRIVNAINHLPAGDVKKLQGEENYRLRVGDIYMSAIKERIMGAVAVMNDNEAEIVWDLIIHNYPLRSWDNIETVAPDEWDRVMLREIHDDPDCKKFVSSEAALKELGL